MAHGLLGKKIGMTQVFNEEGNLLPVTIIDTSSCLIVGKRTPDKDKYSAVILGLGEIKEKSLNAPRREAFKKAGSAPRRHIKEFRVDAEQLMKATVGDAMKVDLFTKGQLVDVTGVTKGRGFAGVIKRWSFKGFRATHGTHEYRRHPGAIGQRKTPGRVYPNKKLPGHYGVEQVTTQNLEVIMIDVDKNLILVKGAIPGHKGSVVLIHPAVKVTLRAAHKAA